MKYAEGIEIYNPEMSKPSGYASASLDATVDVTVAIIGISLNRTEINYGNIKPGFILKDINF
ncbi:MAG: hypothetical protein SVY15_08665 [Halobacteriota archaeon]|nr:hypothetical protein [Halobacteriota archaeon]